MRLLLEYPIVVFSMMLGIGLCLDYPEHASAASSMPCNNAQPAFIIVERIQGGFAGQTAERTSIGEDGCFTVDRLLNGKVIARLHSGRIDRDGIWSMRSAFDSADFASLPAQGGAPAVVNPAFLSVTYRGVTKTAALTSGADIEGIRALSRGSQNDPVTRLAVLALRLLELTDS
jgi:hypothetical protein